MQNMSFMLTTLQMRKRIKRVTRRMGSWKKLRPGDLLCAVEKGMGLKRGEKIRRICTIRVVSVREEPLRAMIDDPDYGLSECVQEGFEDHPSLKFPDQFVEFFCRSHRGCTPGSLVTRIEFEYVD